MARKGLRPKQGGGELNRTLAGAALGQGRRPGPLPSPSRRLWSCCSGLRLPSHKEAPVPVTDACS